MDGSASLSSSEDFETWMKWSGSVLEEEEDGKKERGIGRGTFGLVFFKRLKYLVALLFRGDWNCKGVAALLCLLAFFNVWVVSLTGHVIANFYG